DRDRYRDGVTGINDLQHRIDRQSDTSGAQQPPLQAGQGHHGHAFGEDCQRDPPSIPVPPDGEGMTYPATRPPAQPKQARRPPPPRPPPPPPPPPPRAPPPAGGAPRGPPPGGAPPPGRAGRPPPLLISPFSVTKVIWASSQCRFHEDNPPSW